VGRLDDVATAGSIWSEPRLEHQSQDGFLSAKLSRRQAVEVRADGMMPNADVGLAHSGKNTRRRDGTAKRRLDRAAQRGLADATQVRK